MLKNTYEHLITKINQHMLAGNDNRVQLLSEVLDALGHPEKEYRVIHLAGTNGKGSTGTMLSRLLVNAGYKVGHFSSPALIDQREQITINQNMISKDDFVEIYDEICAKLPNNIKAADISIFEWFVLIMLQFFANQKVKWAVIEAGLGGLNDATNAISAPLITSFTHIALDHVNILGKSIEAIATNKAQIIKNGTTVFVAPDQEKIATEVIEHTARIKKAAEIICVTKRSIQVKKYSLNGFELDLYVNQKNLKNIHFNLIGDFQLQNLATVMKINEWLLSQHLVKDEQPLIQMMAEINIPGRFQILNRNPLVILDGAHNVDATQQLVRSVQKLRPHAKFSFILGFLKDKNYWQMIQIYNEVADKIYPVTPDNAERALDATELDRLLGLNYNQNYMDAQSALAQAQIDADAETVIIVSGSFYLVKELETDNEK
jgi:dihydrofolate synthase/folylpolyglutamate synthase